MEKLKKLSIFGLGCSVVILVLLLIKLVKLPVAVLLFIPVLAGLIGFVLGRINLKIKSKE